MSGEPKLTPAQQAAALDRIRDSLALRSGAGCGKTLVLARRFTELLLASGGRESPLSRFVALTFTDKAALEMQQRTRKFLTQQADRSKGESRRKLLGWLQELPGARISTIHSFCAGLLRAHAIEAGIDPNFAVCADVIVTGAMLDEAVDETALATVEEQRPDVLELLTRMSYDEMVALAADLVARRTEWKAEDYADPAATLVRWRTLLAEQRGRAADRLRADEGIGQRLDELAAARCTDSADELLAIRNDLVARMKRIVDDEQAWSAELFAGLDDLKIGRAGKDKAWGGKGAAKRIRDELKALGAALAAYADFAEVPGELDQAAAKALAALTRLAGQANDAYARAKRSRGILDFTDLLALTHRLLAEKPDVLTALAAQMDQMLIDECQDTDAFQAALLNMLVRGDAKGGPPPPGRLFLVGDAKQSIYRFRGAQVEVFEDLCRRLGPRNLENLDLSFRTHEAGVEFVNELFAPLMGEDYSPIRASRKELPAQPSVEIILAEAAGGEEIASAAHAADLQAAATAHRIREMLADGERIVWDAGARDWRPVRAGDIAVLFSRMTNSLAYERELAARGIGYYVVAGTGFFRRQEVFDVLNALAVVDNPFDDVAFFGVLRGGLFGLDDDALMHLAAAIESPRLAGLLNRPPADVPGLTDPQQATLRFAVELLGDLHGRKDALGIDAVIEHLLASTGYEATLLAQFNGRQMLGNVRRLVELARAATADGAAAGDFLAQMGEQIIDQSRFEQAPVSGEAEDVVRLMTIHKAKGLEFPVVFVPDLNFAAQGVRDGLLNRLDFGLTLDLGAATETADGEDAERAESPVSYRVAKALEERDQRREDIRKLYVAATRHRDHLVFVAADRRTEDGAFRSAGSAIDIMDAQLGVAAAADAGADIPYAGGRFRAAVRKLAPPDAPPGRGRARGRKILEQASSAEELAAAVAQYAGPRPAAMLGAIPATVGTVELAATALAEFEFCPMLYRWQHELRAPVPRAAPAAQRGGADAATMGTLFHRCMELLDFAAPQEPAALIERAAAEQGAAGAIDSHAAAGELAAMLDALKSRPVWKTLRAARQVLRELDFTLQVGRATLGGKIDLLFEDAGGAWHIVDYKSDRVDRDAIPAHAARYELQMLLYAVAAARHLGRPPAQAALYFLRPAAEHAFVVTSAALAAVEPRIAKLAAELLAARRGGSFRRSESPACASCFYGPLCRRTS